VLVQLGGKQDSSQEVGVSVATGQPELVSVSPDGPVKAVPVKRANNNDNRKKVGVKVGFINRFYLVRIIKCKGRNWLY
jgi:hypothetical protein